MVMSETALQKLADKAIELQKQTEENEQAMLVKHPEFLKFMTAQKEAQEQIAQFWQTIEQKMIENGIKSVKGDWGSITIAERLNWKVIGKLPLRFTKRVPDTTKMSDYYRLTGKAPTGAEPSTTKYLTKRIK